VVDEEDDPKPKAKAKAKVEDDEEVEEPKKVASKKAAPPAEDQDLSSLVGEWDDE
jgi:hypothetical protein